MNAPQQPCPKCLQPIEPAQNTVRPPKDQPYGGETLHMACYAQIIGAAR